MYKKRVKSNGTCHLLLAVVFLLESLSVVVVEKKSLQEDHLPGISQTWHKLLMWRTKMLSLVKFHCGH